jgi:hypothetical protein
VGHEYIELTQGYQTKVDLEDVSKLSGFSWFAQKTTNQIYAKFTFCNRAIPMQNVILGIPVGSIVDHIDGDGLNNTKENLRPATYQQNAWNRGLGKNNTSGYKGVVWEADRQKWKARIKVNNKYQHLGRYKKKSDAAKAYAEASERLHGEFGRVK